MNCRYCQKECLELGFNYFRCVPCYTIFKPDGTYIYKSIKNRTFLIILHKEGPIKMTIGTARDPHLIRTTTAPNITPANALKKLKHYLMFS